MGVAVPPPDLAARDAFFAAGAEEGPGAFPPRPAPEASALANVWWSEVDPREKLLFE
jgi:hypothetical protein